MAAPGVLGNDTDAEGDQIGSEAGQMIQCQGISKLTSAEPVEFRSIRVEHAAQLAEYVYYATPNTAAEKLLPQEFLADPVIYPGKEALAKSEFHTPLPPRAAKKRNLAFARLLQ